MRLQRQKDEKKRKALSYQMRLVWGNAPLLPSDTTKEKVLKRYPSRWYALLTDVVNADWEGALKLIEQHDKYLELAKEDVSKVRQCGS